MSSIQPWSAITETPQNVERLEQLSIDYEDLLKHGYVLTQLTTEDVWSKMRCACCGQRMKNWHPSQPHGQLNSISLAQATSPSFQPKHHCLFHDGNLFKGVWQCCNGHMYAQGCCSKLTHQPCDVEEATQQLLYHKTPGWTYKLALLANPEFLGEPYRPRRKSQYTYTHTRPQNIDSDIRTAVAIDCEMGAPDCGTCYDNVLIRLSVVDFFTGESLIDELVVPDVDMLHYNTRFSGVTFADMRRARNSHRSIRGTDAARELLCNYVDSNTFIIMHSGNNDLTALRLIHPFNRIIDTHILEILEEEKQNLINAEYEDTPDGPRLIKKQQLKKGLKEVCLRRCGIEVQNARLANGRRAGHDSLEDALACREIVCSWIRDS